MNEREFGGKVTRLLRQELDGLDAATAAKLKAARLRALEHYEVRQPVLGFAWAGNVAEHVSSVFHRPAVWAPALALLIAMSSAVYWQSRQQNDDAEIDALLLSGDLPISAYIDKDFDAWLKGSSR
jgi:hypothetical protein